MVYNLAPAMFVLLVMLWGPLGVIGWVPHSVCSRVAQTKSLGGMRRYPLSRASGRRRLGQGIVQSVTSTSSNTNEPTADTSNMNKNGDVDSSQNFVYKAVFDFANSTAIDQLDRLDDAIMGGISTSAVRAVPGEGFARWSGVCRTDGGGFCGFRTNPFAEPLLVGFADGFYVSCRLTSDNEPERRVWKMTTRTKPDRGELLYQAPFPFQNSPSQQPDNNEWTIVRVPFSSFRYVRGPRMVPSGPPLDTKSGLYQIGMTMSKFAFAEKTTEIDNFRDGFFELQIKEIGLFKEDRKSIYGGNIQAVAKPKVYSKVEAKSKRPMIVKLLLPLVRIFFSEQSQRRKSAMRILREKKNLSRGQAILWGLRSRAAATGLARSMVKTASILAIDCFRAIISTVLRIAVLVPLRLARSFVGLLTGKNVAAQGE